MVSIKIFFVRHGQSIANLEKKMAGHADIDLTSKGREQALVTAEKLKECDIDIIFCSPLKRARETANIINAIREKEIPIIIKNELMEIDYGIYEGVRKTNFDYHGFWDYSDKNNMNNFFGFAWPLIRFIYCDLMRYYQDKNVLLVAHGGVSKIIEMLLGEYSLLPSEIGVYLPDNSEIVEYENDFKADTIFFKNVKSIKKKVDYKKKLFEIITPNMISKASNTIKRKLGFELLNLSVDDNPRIRNRLGIIVINDEGKVAITTYKNTGEVKLIGGSIDYSIGIPKSIDNILINRFGFLCDSQNYESIGNTIEIRPTEPLANIVISEVVVVKLKEKISEPSPNNKEIKEGFSGVEWLNLEEAYEKIAKSLKSVQAYELLKDTDDYRPLLTKQSIVYRDRLILDYYIKHKL